ncbi:MAG: hypothetical protein K9G62_04750 [Alphaproteobacteria bacterium]|nr:hypothetical protein [Alphaproteobacteria bacterium]
MKPSEQESIERKQRLAEAIKLHEIEGNPLTSDEIAMFEMFEREGWSHERRREYILARYKVVGDKNLAAE